MNHSYKIALSLFWVILLATTLLGCRKDPIVPTDKPSTDTLSYSQVIEPLDNGDIDKYTQSDVLVSGVILPRSFGAVLRNDELTFRGIGFQSTDILIFRNEDNEAFLASTISVTDCEIRFLLPSTIYSGDYAISLRRSGTEQLLGNRSIICDNPSTMNGVTITGEVTCSGAAVPRVVVSDGYAFTLTGIDGRYNLASNMVNGYVFIQVPSLYEVPSEGIIPHFFAHLSESIAPQEANFELIKRNDSQIKIVVFNDVHLNNNPALSDIQQFRNGFLPDVTEHITGFTNGKVYGLTLGDMTTDSRWYSQGFALPDYLKEMSTFPAPVFHCMGNHDNDIWGGGGDFNSAKTYGQIIGPTYYSFNVGEFHIIVIDDIVYDNPLASDGHVNSVNDYDTYLNTDQLEWMKRDLSLVSVSTPIILCCHAPLHRINGISGGNNVLKEGFSDDRSIASVTDILNLYRRVYILSGHTHQNYYAQPANNIIEHNNISVSGSSWQTEPLCGENFSRDGTPAGYSVYTINGDKISWYYKPVGYSQNECQFRVYDMNQVPKEYGGTSNNDVLINIFNWDSEWSICVTENGEPLSVERVWVEDPLYWQSVDGSSLMASSSFKPIGNNHMFRIRATSALSTLIITATDRFGNTYQQTISRPHSFGFDNK